MGVSDWLTEATPDRREVPVCLDRRLMSKLDKLRRAVEAQKAEKMLGGIEARRELEKVERQVAAKTHIMVLEGIGWGRLRDLQAKHPPTEDQREVFERAHELAAWPATLARVELNWLTFIPALISASCVEPEMTEAEALEFLDRMPTAVVDQVIAAVTEVNAGLDDPFVSTVASDGARPSGKRLKPRSPSGSRARSSSDG